MKTCGKCGVALARSHGGDPLRLAVVFDNGHMTCVDLCAGCYRAAVKAALEAMLGSSARVSETANAR